MTEYSSDEEDRRGHNSSDLTPDDFDFDISSYTNQSNFFSRWGWQTIKQRQRWLLRLRSQLPLENKKTERHRSKTDSRNNSKVAQLVRDIATSLTRLSSLQQPQLCFRRSRKQRWVQLLLAEEEERAARSPVGSVETLLSSMFTTVATAASPAKHSSGKTTTTTSVSFHHLKMRRYWSCPRTHNPSDPVHLLSRRAVNWQNKNNRTFQCKFENKCEITIKNRKTCQSCRFQVIQPVPAQWDSQIFFILFVLFRKDRDFTNYLLYAKHSQKRHTSVSFRQEPASELRDMIFYIEKFSLSRFYFIHVNRWSYYTHLRIILISKDKRQIKWWFLWRKY